MIFAIGSQFHLDDHFGFHAKRTSSAFRPEYVPRGFSQEVIITDLRGKNKRLQQLYIRGNQIVFCIVPDMLRNAPMFARIKQWRKYKGHPPILAAEGAKGQRAAIIRKSKCDLCT